MQRPLFPSDGMKYYLAMIEAQAEYEVWVLSRKRVKRVHLLAKRKQQDD